MPFGDGTGPRNSQLKNSGGRHRWLRGGFEVGDEGSWGQRQGYGRYRRRFGSPVRRSCCKRNQPANV